VSAIDVQGLHHTVRPHFYSRPRAILRDVAFCVQPGEIFGFLGPNGAGKTTTIKVMLNLLAPDRGRVFLAGLPCETPEARRCVGFLPERSFYPAHLTAYEFVLGHALLSGLPLGTAQMRTWATLEQVGVGHAAKRRMGTYSKGMLQRAGIAQALVGDPAIIILDEPMSGLDPLGRRDVREIMLSLKAQGKTVFFSTHILPDVERICDRVAIMVGGQVRRMGPLSTLLADGARGLEVDVEALDATGLTAATALSTAHRLHAQSVTFEVASMAQANALIDCVRSHGGRICSMQGSHGGLESLFVGEARS
jgi:ABC-2 type transport system ATP-binding protein